MCDLSTKLVGRVGTGPGRSNSIIEEDYSAKCYQMSWRLVSSDLHHIEMLVLLPFVFLEIEGNVMN
jgi:hypothetical protein